MRSDARGFTLIELLVVITLIAGLMGLGLLLLGQAGKQQGNVETSKRVQALRAALVQLGGSGPGKYDVDVSTDPEKLRGPNREPVGKEMGKPNDTNLGIEAVYAALYMKGIEISLADLPPESLQNTDKDSMSKNVTRTESDEMREFVDHWGNPIAYFYGPEMKRWEEFKKYVMADGRVVEVKPWANEKTGDFFHADTFQLFSAGPDGEFNTKDDIKSW